MTSSFIPAIQGCFLKTAEIGFHASLIIGALLLARPMIKSLLPPRWIYRLWFIVIARLLLTSVPGLPAQMAAQPLAAPLVAVQHLNDASLASVPLIRSSASGFHLTDWQPALALIWLAGALVFLVHFGIAHFRWTRRLSRASTVPHEVIRQLVAACCREMGVRPVRLVQLPGSISPSIAGLFRPTIILPDDCGYRFSREELRWVILHELAHLRRWDLPVQFISQVLQAIHWFNPLVWIAFACLRHDRELACDAHVLDRQAQNTSLDYGHTLIKVAETYPHPALAPGFLGISEEQANLQERVEKIGRHRRPVLLWSVCSLLICALLAFVFLTRLDQPAHVATAKIRTSNSDPAQMDIMQSSDTVMPAIKKLGLDKTWAKRFGSSEDAWTLPEVMDHVSKILTVTQRPGSPFVFYVNVQCEPSQEAAAIANAIVDQYKMVVDASDRADRVSGAAQNDQGEIEQRERDLALKKAALEKFKEENPLPVVVANDPNRTQAKVNQLVTEIKSREDHELQDISDRQEELDNIKARQQRAVTDASKNFESRVEILARAY